MKRILFVVVAVFSLAVASPAFAHEHRQVGAFSTNVGWSEEPTFAGFKNGVTIRIERGAEEHAEGGDHAEGEEEDASATPVTNAKLKVEVIFGDKDAADKTAALDLEPAFGSEGEYRASVIPTRPGTYTFHIFGTIGKAAFDQYYTSSDKTFSVVESPTELEFPAKDPSREQLAARIETTSTQAEAIKGDLALPRTLSIVAIALAAVALWFGLGGRKART